jgi:dienelactone hydrolase
MTVMNKFLSALHLALALAAPLSAFAAPPTALPPIEDFFGNPSFTGALLSPSGKYLAAKVPQKNGRHMLTVVDLQAHKINVVAKFADIDVNQIQWVNDERLLFDSGDLTVAQGDTLNFPGLYAVNRDGTLFRQLASRGFRAATAGGFLMLAPNTYMLPQEGPRDSDWIYVQNIASKGGDHAYVSLLHLNTLTGRSEAVKRPGESTAWLLDSDGEPRLTTIQDKSTTSIHIRSKDSDTWTKLASFEAYDEDKKRFSPIGFGPDGTLYVLASRSGPYAGMYAMDMATGKIAGKPLVQLDGFDFSGHLIIRQKQLIGVRYQRDATGTAWFDPRMQAMQADVDKLLPNMVNLLELPSRAESANVLVQSYSDVQPAVSYIYNSEAKTLEKVGETHPTINATQMGGQEYVRYKARDGLEIPALLTVPLQSDGKKLPMVVLVHGGPYLRGTHWGWDPEVQFLASRGYAVLQPEFRGSAGYGWDHFHAGWKQWGLKMQDDIADGVKWAVANGYADAKRICIAGASYGGYATLMGLVNDPDLYQCGVEWAGVTDINLMYNGHWRFRSDMTENWKSYGMPVLIGDQEKDAAQLKATSPLEQAARVTRPLLLAYGAADRRVPLAHGLKFRDAVKTTNKDVEWIEYAEEGHGWFLPKNRIDFWGRVEKFLDKHIGAGAKTE